MLKPFPVEEYRKAIAAERFSRNVAFCDLPLDICGVPVRPLTLRHIVLLETIGSPFLVGGRATFVDVAGFLWLVSTRYSQSKLRRWWFYRSIRKLKFDKAVDGIREYTDSALADMPGGSGGKTNASYYASAVGLIDLFASEYGWSMKETMGSPMAQLLQCRNRIFHRQGDIMFNPSDGVKQRWLDASNN